jgi:anti-anti-sigma factor
MRDHGDVRNLRLLGEFDTEDAAALAERLDAAVSPGAWVVLDLGGVRFASAAVLGCFAEARAKARKRGGGLAVSGATGIIGRTLRLLELDRLLGMLPRGAEALRRRSQAMSPFRAPEAPLDPAARDRLPKAWPAPRP